MSSDDSAAAAIMAGISDRDWEKVKNPSPLMLTRVCAYILFACIHQTNAHLKRGKRFCIKEIKTLSHIVELLLYFLLLGVLTLHAHSAQAVTVAEMREDATDVIALQEAKREQEHEFDEFDETQPLQLVCVCICEKNFHK